MPGNRSSHVCIHMRIFKFSFVSSIGESQSIINLLGGRGQLGWGRLRTWGGGGGAINQGNTPDWTVIYRVGFHSLSKVKACVTRLCACVCEFLNYLLAVF